MLFFDVVISLHHHHPPLHSLVVARTTTIPKKNVWGSARCADTSDGEWDFFVWSCWVAEVACCLVNGIKRAVLRCWILISPPCSSPLLLENFFSNLKNSMNERWRYSTGKNKLQLWSSGGWSVLISLFVLYIYIYFLFIIKKERIKWICYANLAVRSTKLELLCDSLAQRRWWWFSTIKKCIQQKTKKIVKWLEIVIICEWLYSFLGFRGDEERNPLNLVYCYWPTNWELCSRHVMITRRRCWITPICSLSLLRVSVGVSDDTTMAMFSLRISGMIGQFNFNSISARCRELTYLKDEKNSYYSAKRLNY